MNSKNESIRARYLLMSTPSRPVIEDKAGAGHTTGAARCTGGRCRIPVHARCNEARGEGIHHVASVAADVCRGEAGARCTQVS